jgi:subtilisin family serine protease
MGAVSGASRGGSDWISIVVRASLRPECALTRERPAAARSARRRTRAQLASRRRAKSTIERVEMTALAKILLSRRRLLQCAITGLTALACTFILIGNSLAQWGRPSNVSADLVAVIDARTTPKVSFARDSKGVRYVKALIVSNSTDPDLVQLRGAVIAAGGSVYLRYVSVAAISVMLPAGKVYAIAARFDVQTISANRLTARTLSTLESTTGAADVRVPNTAGTAYTGIDGTGVGIAVLDSGIAWSHKDFLGNDGKTSRVAKAVDFQKVGDATALGVKDWTPGIDASASLYPGSATVQNYEQKINAFQTDRADLYGHGSHVAGVAAGRGGYQATDSTGVAPNATLYDVKVLDQSGYGQLSDVLAGIDWVIYHAKDYNIRVINLSLAADSTESYLTDPLCRAVRSAATAGIVVVVAAGNFGQDATGAERYGSIGAPGNDPTAITVGSANTFGTLSRSDDAVNHFSSRGPTRSSYVDGMGQLHVDNLLKPDLVAPGNKIVGVLASDKAGAGGSWSYLARTYPALSSPYGSSARQPSLKQILNLSGTSIAAPAVTGAVALMLQANPGLTPPLVKAILQYTAQPLAGANLLQQGAGELNVDGAVRLAQALRTDVSGAIAGGTIHPGDSLVAAGKTMPAPQSTVGGASVPWSRLAFVGGSQIASGAALLGTFQPIYDPRLVWAGANVHRSVLTWWPASGSVPANRYVRSVLDQAAPDQALLTNGVTLASAIAGDSSWQGRTGVFAPTATLTNWLAAGSGFTLGQGIVRSEGRVFSEGLVLGQGVVLSEGLVLGEGLVLSEGMVLSEGLVLSEAGQTQVLASSHDASLLGE